MSNKELYAELKKKAETIKSKILSRNGERNVYIQNLKNKGFNSLSDVESYIEQAKLKQKEKELIIKEKLMKYEAAIKEAEIALGE